MGSIKWILYRRLSWAALCLPFFFYSVDASAALWRGLIVGNICAPANGSFIYESPDAAMNACLGVINQGKTAPNIYAWCGPAVPPAQGGWNRPLTYGGTGCGQNYTQAQSQGNDPAFSCPAGTVPNYTTGACDVENNCPASGVQHSSGYYDLGTSESGSMSSSYCVSGCMYQFEGTGTAVARAQVFGVYHYYAQGAVTSIHETCTSGNSLPSNTIDVPPNTCNNATQDEGQVNGVTVCLDKSTTETENSTLVTNPDGSTTQTTTKQNADGTQTTTTTNTNSSGTTTSTTTTTSAGSGTGSGSSWCQQHPNDPQCQAYKNDEEGLGDPVNFDEALPDGTFPGMPDQGSLEGLEVSYSRLGGVTGACPAPITFSAMGQQFEIDFTAVCDYADLITAIMILVAAFVSFRILLM